MEFKCAKKEKAPKMMLRSAAAPMMKMSAPRGRMDEEGLMQERQKGKTYFY